MQTQTIIPRLIYEWSFILLAIYLMHRETIDDEEELLYGEPSMLNVKKEAEPVPGSGTSGLMNRKPAW